MTDWPEAGRKSWKTRHANDARRVLGLYRTPFDNPAKAATRRRMVEVLRAAGGTTVLDLWGGGLSAEAEVAVGLKVVSVDDGSMALLDKDQLVSSTRKRRALELAAAEGGYEARWGAAWRFAAECDVALLDFHGPWTPATRRVVEACRHMKAIVVTLVADHDLHSGALTPEERRAAYGLWIKMAYRPSTGRISGLTSAEVDAIPGRLLSQYRRPGGRWVFVFLVAASRVSIRHRSTAERYAVDPVYRARTNVHQATYQRERRAVDPEYKARQYERVRRWKERNWERLMLTQRHRKHRVGTVPRKPCALCTPAPS